MKYSKYPNYHDSGVELLAELPEHWKIKKLKFNLVLQNMKSDIGKKTVIALENIESWNGKYIETDATYQGEDVEFCAGDILFGKLRPYLAKVYRCTNRGISFGDLLTYRPSLDINTDFSFFYLISENFINIVNSSTYGTKMPRASSEFIANIYMMIPPLQEQQTIASYLDIATAKIDTLIEKQIKLIELLKEKRQTKVDKIIHKQSIEKQRLRHVVNQIFRPVTRRFDEEYEVLGVYNRGRGLFHKPLKSEDELGDSSFYWVEENDLILSGQFAWEGSVALASKDENNCIVSHRYPIIQGKENIMDTEYLWAYFTTKEGDFILNEHSVGSAGRNRPLNINTLLKEKIPVPPIEEQREVAKIVKAEKKIKILIDKAIVLLKEKRTALISSAVTGKIDVREAQ